MNNEKIIRVEGIVLHRDPKIIFTRKKPDIFRAGRVRVKYFSGNSGSGKKIFLIFRAGRVRVK
jgi:hypothetical protein